MFETLFGEGQYGLRFVFAIIVVLGLIALTAWLVRRFGSERLGTSTTRGRQPRLAVIDAASVDGRRRLVLIRRDNVEHLMMIGGPTDVVVEANIVRGVQQPREGQAPRAPATTDTLPRAVPLGEGTSWPLQPEPMPAPRPEPRPEPRMQRPAPPPPAPMPEEHQSQWDTEPEPLPPQPAPLRRARPPVDPLVGLADELARTPAPPPEQANGDARVARREPREQREVREQRESREPAREQREVRAPRPQAVAPPPPPAPAPAAEVPFNSSADQNLAEMAQRLEAALRRPGKPEEARFTEPAPSEADERAPARPARSDKPAGSGKSSLYDSLEQEMASLLGRPGSKP